jgi:hypothetical protein
MAHRLLILALLAAFSVSAQNTQPVRPAPKVVFVCEHGAAKSVIAAAHMRRLAAEKGLNLEVISRGSTPDPEIPAAVIGGLKKDGIDFTPFKPVQVTRADLAGAAVVISFGPDLSLLTDGKIKVQDWSATPTVSGNYDAARTYIVARLQELLDTLTSESNQARR